MKSISAKEFSWSGSKTGVIVAPMFEMILGLPLAGRADEFEVVGNVHTKIFSFDKYNFSPDRELISTQYTCGEFTILVIND